MAKKTAAAKEAPVDMEARLDVLRVLAHTQGQDIAEEIDGKTFTVFQDGTVQEHGADEPTA